MQIQVLGPGAFFVSQDLELSVEINMFTIILLERKNWLNAQERLGIKENWSFFPLADLRQVTKGTCVFFSGSKFKTEFTSVKGPMPVFSRDFDNVYRIPLYKGNRNATLMPFIYIIIFL